MRLALDRYFFFDIFSKDDCRTSEHLEFKYLPSPEISSMKLLSKNSRVRFLQIIHDNSQDNFWRRPINFILKFLSYPIRNLYWMAASAKPLTLLVETCMPLSSQEHGRHPGQGACSSCPDWWTARRALSATQQGRVLQYFHCAQSNQCQAMKIICEIKVTEGINRLSIHVSSHNIMLLI